MALRQTRPARRRLLPIDRKGSGPNLRRELFTQLVLRDIRSRFVGSASGWVWLFLTPLLLLAVYGLVFGVIFSARVPAGLEVPFIAWLALALWPWLAFSEGTVRGAQAIRQHANLISKVSLPRHLLVASSTSAVFVLHLLGYALVLFVLWAVMGVPLQAGGILSLLFALASLYLFALGLGLGLGALQVYLRDLEQFVPTFFLFWFFMTPILYPADMLPAFMSRWMAINPMSNWMELIRSALLEGQMLPGLIDALVMLASAAAALVIGGWLFMRLAPYFEDFL